MSHSEDHLRTSDPVNAPKAEAAPFKTDWEIVSFSSEHGLEEARRRADAVMSKKTEAHSSAAKATVVEAAVDEAAHVSHSEDQLRTNDPANAPTVEAAPCKTD